MLYSGTMRTTVNLDDDVVAAMSQLRRDESLGLSEAVNRLARAGMAHAAAPEPFRQRSTDLGIRIDVSNIGDVLDALDEH